MRALICVIGATLLLSGAAGALNLLTNPSFEDPDVAPGTAQIFPDSIPGWTDTSGCGIEVQDHCCGSPSQGDQHVELNTTCASAINQIVATQPGANYVLTFDFSPRPGVGDNHLLVRWNGGLVFDQAVGGIGLVDTVWTAYVLHVTATGTTSTVEFSDGGFGNGVGPYIDNLPEPGRATQLFAGLLAIAGLARRRVGR
jgi:hypothetical protein